MATGGHAQGVLRRPMGVSERLDLGRGRGRGRGLNMAVDSKVVGAQNQSEGMLVSDSGVKKSEIINVKPRVKRVTNSTNQGLVQKCISGNQIERVAPVGTSEIVQIGVTSEPILGNVAGEGATEHIDCGLMRNPADASLAKLESRISTLELEVFYV